MINVCFECFYYSSPSISVCYLPLPFPKQFFKNFRWLFNRLKTKQRHRDDNKVTAAALERWPVNGGFICSILLTIVS